MAELEALLFDALAPHELAAFWAVALRWDVADGDDMQAVIVPDDDTGFEIRFRRAATAKAGRGLIHFDLTTTSLDDQRDSVAALIDRGARHVDVGQGPDEQHVVLADPEGNELCVIEPGTQFLGDCPRLGAVNCDGTHALGEFWGAVLGWPLVWDFEEETAIRDPRRLGPKITWSGPPLLERVDNERIRFVMSGEGTDFERLVALGARRRGAVWLDPDGNEFVVA